MNRRGLRSRRGALAGLGGALALLMVPVISGGLPSPQSGPLLDSATASPPVSERQQRKAKKLPNVIVITTDDQPTSLFAPRFMPQTFKTIGSHPDTARFTNGLALPPVCCPYRASFLSGQYPHNNGVYANFPGYNDLRGKRNVLPVWLQRLGYYTAVAGKYLNGTAAELARQGREEAPGWHEWFVRTGESNSYFDVEFTDRRPADRHQRAVTDDLVNPPPSTYFTDVVTRRALEFLEDRAKDNAENRRKPFFLWIPHLAPHLGTDTQHGDQNECSPHRFASVKDELLEWAEENIDPAAEVSNLPAFGEPDISDKPGRSRKKERLTTQKIALIVQAFECAAAAIKGVDESNAAVWSKLGQLNLRRDTIIIFGSDNGYYYGEHRLVLKKGVSYEPGLRVPLMVKVPAKFNRNGQSPPPTVRTLAGPLDLAPTLLDYAGAPRGSCREPTNCRTMDGRSLRAVLGDRAKPKIGRLNPSMLLNRSMLIERVKPCFWPALRTPHAYYSIDPYDGSSLRRDCGGIRADEIYDLDTDPAEEENLADRKRWRRRIEERFLPKLLQLRRCQGIKRRDDRAVVSPRKTDPQRKKDGKEKPAKPKRLPYCE